MGAFGLFLHLLGLYLHTISSFICYFAAEFITIIKKLTKYKPKDKWKKEHYC